LPPADSATDAGRADDGEGPDAGDDGVSTVDAPQPAESGALAEAANADLQTPSAGEGDVAAAQTSGGKSKRTSRTRKPRKKAAPAEGDVGAETADAAAGEGSSGAAETGETAGMRTRKSSGTRKTATGGRKKAQPADAPADAGASDQAAQSASDQAVQSAGEDAAQTAAAVGSAGSGSDAGQQSEPEPQAIAPASGDGSDADPGQGSAPEPADGAPAETGFGEAAQPSGVDEVGDQPPAPKRRGWWQKLVN
jgi:ribonuclease E